MVVETIEKWPIIKVAGDDPAEWLARDWRRDPYKSNSFIVVLRLLVSAFLRLNAEEFLPFIWESIPADSADSQDPTSTIIQYCQKHVESFGAEADQIHIIALTRSLGCRIEIAYLDTSASESLYLEFGEDPQGEFGPSPISLLYRPGHYDIVYKK